MRKIINSLKRALAVMLVTAVIVPMVPTEALASVATFTFRYSINQKIYGTEEVISNRVPWTATQVYTGKDAGYLSAFKISDALDLKTKTVTDIVGVSNVAANHYGIEREAGSFVRNGITYYSPEFTGGFKHNSDLSETTRTFYYYPMANVKFDIRMVSGSGYSGSLNITDKSYLNLNWATNFQYHTGDADLVSTNSKGNIYPTSITISNGSGSQDRYSGAPIYVSQLTYFNNKNEYIPETTIQPSSFGSTVRIYTTKTQNTFTITVKENGTGAPISGVTFSTIDPWGVKMTATSNALGQAIFTLPYNGNGTYTFKEESFPKGYINRNQTYELTCNGDGHGGTAAREVLYSYYPELAVNGLTISATDDVTGAAIPSARFELVKGGTVVKTLTTDSSGEASFIGIENGTYSLTQKASAQYYSFSSSPTTVDINNNDKLVNIKNTRLKGSMSVRLVDNSGQPIPGAKFILSGEDVNQILTSDTNGYMYLANLKHGPYNLVEYAMPDGVNPKNLSTSVVLDGLTQGTTLTYTYANIVGNAYIRVIDDENGEPIQGLRYQIQKPNGDEYYAFTTNSLGTGQKGDMPAGQYILHLTANDWKYRNADDLVFNITDYYTKVIDISLVKNLGSVELRVRDMDSENPIQGAVFELRDNKGNLVKTLTTDESGNAAIDNLPYEQYTLQQIGNNAIYKTDDTEIPLTVDDVSIVVNRYSARKNGKLVLQFKDSYTENNMCGEIPVKITDKSNSLIEYELETDRDGYLEIYLPFGEYTVTQADAVESYYNAPDLDVVINSDTEDSAYILYNAPYRGSIEINVVDAIGDALVGGISFELRDWSAELIETINVDSTGKAIVENLPYGQYSLKEISTNANYQANAATASVTLDAESVTYNHFINRKTGRLVLQCIDTFSGENIKGEIGIKLIDKSGNRVEYNLTTNGEGHLDTNMPLGDYEAIQTAMPRGYYSADAVDVSVILDAAESIYTIYSNPYGCLTVSGIDASTGEIIPNLLFTITSQDGQAVKLIDGDNDNEYNVTEITHDYAESFTTGDTGVAYIVGLTYGDYTINQINKLPDHILPAGEDVKIEQISLDVRILNTSKDFSDDAITFNAWVDKINDMLTGHGPDYKQEPIRIGKDHTVEIRFKVGNQTNEPIKIQSLVNLMGTESSDIVGFTNPFESKWIWNSISLDEFVQYFYSPETYYETYSDVDGFMSEEDYNLLNQPPAPGDNEPEDIEQHDLIEPVQTIQDEIVLVEPDEINQANSDEISQDNAAEINQEALTDQSTTIEQEEPGDLNEEIFSEEIFYDEIETVDLVNEEVYDIDSVLFTENELDGEFYSLDDNGDLDGSYELDEEPPSPPSYEDYLCSLGIPTYQEYINDPQVKQEYEDYIALNLDSSLSKTAIIYNKQLLQNIGSIEPNQEFEDVLVLFINDDLETDNIENHIIASVKYDEGSIGTIVQDMLLLHSLDAVVIVPDNPDDPNNPVDLDNPGDTDTDNGTADNNTDNSNDGNSTGSGSTGNGGGSSGGNGSGNNGGSGGGKKPGGNTNQDNKNPGGGKDKEHGENVLQTTPTPDQQIPETMQPPTTITPASDETALVEEEQASLEMEQTLEDLPLADALQETTITPITPKTTVTTPNTSNSMSATPIATLATDAAATYAAVDLTDMYETKSFIVMYDPEAGRYIIIDKGSRIAIGYTLKPYYTDEEILKNIIYFGANPNLEDELLTLSTNMQRIAIPSYNQDALIRDMEASKTLPTEKAPIFNFNVTALLWVLVAMFAVGLLVIVIILLWSHKKRSTYDNYVKENLSRNELAESL